MKTHELLSLDEEKLKTNKLTNEDIKNAHKIALEKIERQKDLGLKAFQQKELELAQAFDSLNDATKRQKYVQQLLEEQAAQRQVSLDVKGKTYNTFKVAGNSFKEIEQNLNLIKTEYNKFVQDKYKDLPENEKAKYAIKEFTFKTYDDLVKSDYYKSLPRSEQLAQTKENFHPFNVIALNFKDEADMEAFIKNLREKKLIIDKPSNAPEQPKTSIGLHN